MLDDPRIRIDDLAYTAYQVTDLDLMERFLVDFGMKRSARDATSLYMRGTGPAHHIHVARLGETNRFLGGAFRVQSLQDLEKAAKIEGASAITAITEPGGGQRVTLTTPGGHTIWLEYGAQTLPELPTRRIYPLNFHGSHLRPNRPVRQKKEITPILRIGHYVLRVTDAAKEVAWFRKHFSLVPSDYICGRHGKEGDPDSVAGTFLRLDRGQEFVDHHIILVNQSHLEGCHHSSYEVLDLDAVTTGHHHLVKQGWNLDAGYGRHYLGSLIYDYWLDPFGNRVEHYTDTDLVNDDYVPVYFTGTVEETTQWGMSPPPSFFD